MGLEDHLRQVIRAGAIEVALPGGRRIVAGDGSRPRVVVALKSPLWVARILAWPEVALGDAYMEGALTFERGGVYDLLDLAGRNTSARRRRRPLSAFARWRHDMLATRNARRQARRNVERHYDLSNAFYRRFLDADLQYSCAYFADPSLSLEEAQQAKQRHIEAKLLLRPGHSVLDIGCGWGGLALRLAADTGAQVHGVTLSTPSSRSPSSAPTTPDWPRR